MGKDGDWEWVEKRGLWALAEEGKGTGAEEGKGKRCRRGKGKRCRREGEGEKQKE